MMRFSPAVFFVFLTVSLNAAPVIVPLENLPVYKGSYALLIGASTYRNGFQNIYGVREDITAIETILQLYNFKTFVVMEPDHQKLRQALDGFVETFGMEPENRLIIYYSGHGKRLLNEDSGVEREDADHYLVPVDAPSPEIDRIGFLKHAMHFDRLLHYSKTIKSKHVLFVLDSCFSGGIFGVSKNGASIDINRNAGYAVRQFITAGRHDETVPDDGHFRNRFIEALQGRGDLNADSYLTGSEIGQYIQTTISTTGRQPQYGKINGDDPNTGEFVIALDPEIDERYSDIISRYKEESELVDTGMPFKIAALAGIGLSLYGMKVNFDKVQNLTDENRQLERDYDDALSMTQKEAIREKHEANIEEANRHNDMYKLFGWTLVASAAWEAYLVWSTPERKPRDDTWKLVFVPSTFERQAYLTFQYRF